MILATAPALPLSSRWRRALPSEPVPPVIRTRFPSSGAKSIAFVSLSRRAKPLAWQRRPRIREVCIAHRGDHLIPIYGDYPGSGRKASAVQSAITVKALIAIEGNAEAVSNIDLR